MIEKKFSNINHNNNLQFLKAFFNMLVNREVIKKSPCRNIKYLKTTSKSHLVYSDNQREAIKKALQKEDPQMFLYINFIYYTFVRPNELRFSKIKQIQGSRFLVPDSIHYQGERIPVSKNGKSQYVVIPEGLQQLIEEYNICAHDPDNFIFSASLRPDKHPVSYNFFNTRYREIMNSLGIPKGHTAYAWKHTGVCKLYQRIKDPKAVQDQCRHGDLKTTIIYLRDLGMFENNEVEEKFPTF